MGRVFRRIDWGGLALGASASVGVPFSVWASVVFGLSAVGLLASGCVGSVFVSPSSVRAGVDFGAC